MVTGCETEPRQKDGDQFCNPYFGNKNNGCFSITSVMDHFSLDDR